MITDNKYINTDVMIKCSKMIFNWILAVLLVAAAEVYAGAKASGRIVGGTTTAIENWPYIVQVESTATGLSWSQYCAGNILNNRFVLSAAQCFDGILFSASRRRLRGGSANRGSGGVVIAINRVFKHPNYSSSTKENDLTIVEQSAAWVWSTRIQPITIVPQNFQLPDNLPVVLAGWGATRDGGIFGQTSSTLREVTVQSVNREWCAEVYEATSRVVGDAMLCTGAHIHGLDSCSSDEGGPVYYVDANNLVTLVGIISWRHACGNATLPSVNTRVSAYTNWIVINASNAS